MSSGKYESSDGNSIGTAVTFLLIGIGIGAATALLLAPKTGKQFRKDLKRGYGDARDRISDWSDDAREAVGDMRDRVSDLHETVRDKVSDAMDRGADIAEAVREKATPLGKVLRRS
jgi:gas vesicle protein